MVLCQNPTCPKPATVESNCRLTAQFLGNLLNNPSIICRACGGTLSMPRYYVLDSDELPASEIAGYKDTPKPA